MQRTIYIDSIFLSNLIMDLLLLFLTTRTVRKSAIFLKTVNGSGFRGGVCCQIKCLRGRNLIENVKNYSTPDY